MTQTIYVHIVAGLLLVSGFLHIAARTFTERWMSQASVVRVVGVLLLVLAIPCLLWRGWYFWTLFAGLAISGVWRAGFPQNSIRAQLRTYPRWVHGGLLIGGAVLIWAMRP